MDIFILLATMLVCFLIGMPIAYSLAMAAIAGALSVGEQGELMHAVGRRNIRHNNNLGARACLVELRLPFVAD